MLRSLLIPRWLYAWLAVTLVLAALEVCLQGQETSYIHSFAQEVVGARHAATRQEKIIALRDYASAHVLWRGTPANDRSLLRATAAEVLRTGRGGCGDATRAFICMAATVGIRAQRLNLYGAQPRVVAEVELAPGDRRIADCQNPPQVPALARPEGLEVLHEYDDYSTLNLRGVHLDAVISRLKLRIQPLTYWLENPHTLKALFWLCAALVATAVALTRLTLRAVLKKRGWVHRSELRPG